MNRSTILGFTAGLLSASAAAGAASLGATWYLARAAMDREQPRGSRRAEARLAGAAEDGDFEAFRDWAEKQMLRIPGREVTVTSRDGLPLAGHWYPVRRPKRVVIAMHGWRSSWSRDYCLIADFLREEDCSVLYAEQRGQGGSGGEAMGFGGAERHDCLDWVQWVNAHGCDQLPVYLCGISMGATTVLMASALALPENVRGIIADCGFTSADEIWEHIARDNLHMAYHLRRPLARRLYETKHPSEVFDYSTEDALRHAKVPVLFIHGTADRFVPVEMTYRNYLACAGPRELLVVPGAEHGMSYLKDRGKYEDTVRDFWKKWDS